MVAIEQFRLSESACAVFECALDAMLIADDAGRYVDVNSAACELLGHTRGELLGMTVLDINRGEGASEGWYQFIAAGSARLTWHYTRPDGQHRWIDALSRANILPGYHLAVLRDVTLERRAAEQLRRSEELYSKIFRSSPVALALSTVPEGRIRDVNEAAVVLAGRPREHLIGFTGAELGLWADPDPCERIAKTMSPQLESRDVATRVRRPSGEIRDVLLSTEPIDVGGERCILHVLADVTAQNSVERMLHEAQAIGQLGSWTADVRVGTIYWSTEAQRIVGLPRRESTYEEFLACVHPDDREAVAKLADEVAASVRNWDHQYRVVRPDGQIAWVHSRGTAEHDARGLPARILGSLQDITERRLADARLEASERRYRRILEMAPNAMALLDRDGRCSLINDALCALLGVPRDAVIGRHCSELVVPEDRELVEAMRAQRAAGSADTYDLRVQHSSGAILLVEVGASSLLDERGTPEGTLVMLTDVTSRRHAEEVRAQLAAIVESSRDAITSCSLDGTIQTWNVAAERLFGYTANEAIGESFTMLVPPDRLAMYRESVEQVLRGEVSAAETVRVRKDGTHVDVSITRSSVLDDEGRVVAISTIARDISAHKRLEASLRETEERLNNLQRMEAIGALAGGIAHDFNNILSVILSSATLIEESLAGNDPMIEDVRAICDASDRATKLTRQLLAFSRKQVLEPTVLNLESTLTGMEKILRRLLGEQITLMTHASGAGNVLFDAGQFEQVLLNLAVNARDAMPRGGELVIECENVTVDEEVATGTGAQPGAFVRITVSDTGTGMDAETRSRAIEPFFTTKPKGKGTGLGLATVFGIVRQSGGFMHITSEPGRGTSFDIYIPRTERVAAHSITNELPKVMSGRGETILVVEDEEPVRKLVQRVLRRQGYEVITAANAGEAMLICEQRDRIDVVLTDVVMPLMNGRQLAERLLALHPQLRIAYMSGYHDDELLHDMVGSSSVVFLQKPLSRDVLLRKIRELLDRD